MDTTAISKIKKLEEVPQRGEAVLQLISPPSSEYPLAGLIIMDGTGKRLVLFKRDSGQFGRLIYRMPNGKSVGEVDLTSEGVNLGPGQFVFDYRLSHLGVGKDTLGGILLNEDLRRHKL